MTAVLAPKAYTSPRLWMLDDLEKCGVETLVKTKVVKIAENGVWVENVEGEVSFIEADSVIIAAGTKAKAAEREMFKDVAFDVINIGDCAQAANIAHATETAYNAALMI